MAVNWAKKLRNVRKVALDTMCFIYFFEGNKKYGILLQELFLYLKEKNKTFYTSTITFAEFLSSSEVFKDPLLVEKHKSAFYQMKNLEFYPVDLMVAEKSAFFRTKYNLKLPDAIQIATTILSGAKAFITNDEKFKKVKEVKVIILKDLI